MTCVQSGQPLDLAAAEGDAATKRALLATRLGLHVKDVSATLSCCIQPGRGACLSCPAPTQGPGPHTAPHGGYLYIKPLPSCHGLRLHGASSGHPEVNGQTSKACACTCLSLTEQDHLILAAVCSQARRCGRRHSRGNWI